MVPEYVHGPPQSLVLEQNGSPAAEYIYGPGPFASSSPPPSKDLDVDRRSSINGVPHVVLNKVAEYSDMPERIRLRQVNSTLRDGVPPTVPPWYCAFTDHAILGSCDAFWSKMAEIMAWFLVITHNGVKEDSTLFFPPTVYFEINRKLQAPMYLSAVFSQNSKSCIFSTAISNCTQ